MAEKDNDSFEISLGIGFTFIILGIIIQFVFLESNAALWFSTIFIALGVAFLGSTLDENNDPKKGFENIGIGVLFFLPSFLGLLYFSNVFLKILFIGLLVFGILFIILGIIRQFTVNTEKKNENKASEIIKQKNTPIDIKKIIVGVISLIGFLSNIVTIVSIFI